MKKLLLFLVLLGILGTAQAAGSRVLMPTDTTGMIYDTPEIMPQFPGGPHALDLHVRNNIKYPKEAREKKLTGKVYVEFVVEKDGSISNVSVRMGRHDVLNKEAMRMVKDMPKWKPGSNRKKIVRTRYTLPIQFAL